MTLWKHEMQGTFGIARSTVAHARVELVYEKFRDVKVRLRGFNFTLGELGKLSQTPAPSCGARSTG